MQMQQRYWFGRVRKPYRDQPRTGRAVSSSPAVTMSRLPLPVIMWVPTSLGRPCVQACLRVSGAMAHSWSSSPSTGRELMAHTVLPCTATGLYMKYDFGDLHASAPSAIL